MFVRRPLRTDVAAEVQQRIIDGRLPSGLRINESHLAAELGVSRTPLREAMLCLATEGVLKTDMGRGFSVPHLVGREAADVLAALGVVLAAAIDRSGQPELKNQLEARNLLGRARMQSAQPASFCDHVQRLMRQFTAGCENDFLRRECDCLTRLALRYVHEGLVRGHDVGPVLNGLENGVEAWHRGQRADAAETLGRAVRELGTDLMARFPTEAVEPI